MINQIESIYKERIMAKESIYIEDPFKNVSLNELSAGNRVAIKVIYILHNVLEVHLQKILYPIYGNHGFEKALSKLISEGWLYKERMKEGNMVAVTRKTMQYIVSNGLNVEKAAIKEGNISLYCSKGNIIANFILQKYIVFLREVFNSLTKEEKRSYLKKQYIEHIVYKSFLELSEEQQKEVLDQMNLTNEERDCITEGKMKKMNRSAIKIIQYYLGSIG